MGVNSQAAAVDATADARWIGGFCDDVTGEIDVRRLERTSPDVLILSYASGIPMRRQPDATNRWHPVLSYVQNRHKRHFCHGFRGLW